MDLKVWFDKVCREVCGASTSTTCRDVIMVLAQNINLSGRFTLYANTKNGLIPLFPTDKPVLYARRHNMDLDFVLHKNADSNSASRSSSSGGAQIDSAKASSASSSGAAPPPHYSNYAGAPSNNSMYQKLFDHVAYQEQDIEYNQKRLHDLDKEIRRLKLRLKPLTVEECKALSRNNTSELNNYGQYDWAKIIEENKTLTQQLKSEKDLQEKRIVEVDQELVQLSAKIKSLNRKYIEEKNKQLMQQHSAAEQQKCYGSGSGSGAAGGGGGGRSGPTTATVAGQSGGAPLGASPAVPKRVQQQQQQQLSAGMSTNSMWV